MNANVLSKFIYSRSNILWKIGSYGYKAWALIWQNWWLYKKRKQGFLPQQHIWERIQWDPIRNRPTWHIDLRFPVSRTLMTEITAVWVKIMVFCSTVELSQLCHSSKCQGCLTRFSHFIRKAVNGTKTHLQRQLFLGASQNSLVTATWDRR